MIIALAFARYHHTNNNPSVKFQPRNQPLFQPLKTSRSTKIYLNSLFESNGKAMGSCPGPTIAAVRD